MPALSPTMTEGSLNKWLVKVGDKIKAGDVLAEIETDKATMEVEAVDEGVISEILIKAGTTGIGVNSPIALIQSEGESLETTKVKEEGINKELWFTGVHLRDLRAIESHLISTMSPRFNRVGKKALSA